MLIAVTLQSHAQPRGPLLKEQVVGLRRDRRQETNEERTLSPALRKVLSCFRLDSYPPSALETSGMTKTSPARILNRSEMLLHATIASTEVP